MTAFRLFSRLNTFYGLTGQLLAGGELRFYDAGTTTPRDVYGDSDLSVNNGVTVDLDSSGRPDVDVWGEGAYFVEAYDALGVKQGEADDVQIPGAGGLAIPALETGKFLTNNGAVLLWNSIREVPDPTGQGGKQLGTDGDLIFWEAKPTVTTSDVTIATDRIVYKSSDGTRAWQVLKGTATIPASGSNTASLPVTFANAFKSGEVPSVTLTPAPGTQPGGPAVAYLSAAPTASGFTAVVDVAEGNSVNQNITVAVILQWRAEGEIDP